MPLINLLIACKCRKFAFELLLSNLYIKNKLLCFKNLYNFSFSFFFSYPDSRRRNRNFNIFTHNYFKSLPLAYIICQYSQSTALSR